MELYVCNQCELISDSEGKKNPYLRLTFNKKANSNASDPFARLERGVVIVLSGGYFDANNKPDLKKNYDWCKQNQSVFQGAETMLHEFMVETEPYYNLVNGKPTGDAKTSIGITTFAMKNEAGEVVPRFASESQMRRNAASRIANGTNMYVTAAQLEAQKAIDSQIDGVTTDAFAGSGASEGNPYA